MPQLNKCLSATCSNNSAAQCKGLCMRCYSSAKKQVAAGKVTWEKFAELGMIELEKTPFEAELEERLKREHNAATDRETGTAETNLSNRDR